MAKGLKGRRRGRPATGGRDPQVTFRFPAETIAAIDAYAEQAGLTRSAAARRLIDKGLAMTPDETSLAAAVRQLIDQLRAEDRLPPLEQGQPTKRGQHDR